MEFANSLFMAQDTLPLKGKDVAPDRSLVLRDLMEAKEPVSDQLKMTFKSILDDGITVRDTTTFQALNGLIGQYTDAKLCSYTDIVQDQSGQYDLSKGFTISKDPSNNRVYFYPLETGLFSTAFGYAENGKFHLRSFPERMHQFDNPDNNTTFTYVPPLRVPIAPKADEIIVPKDLDYKVVKGDTLWKIIKEQYGLTNSRDIANAINSLVRENVSIRGIKQDIAPQDKIYGDILRANATLHIPGILKVLGKEVLRKHT